MSPAWVHLPLLKFTEIGRKEDEDKGVKIQLYVSPHDVPLAVRGFPDEKTGHFVIEFRYLDDEPVATKQEGTNVLIRLGKHSRRIFAIELDLAELRAETVQLELMSVVRSAVRKLDDARDDASLKTNHRLAVNVIEERKERLLPSIA